MKPEECRKRVAVLDNILYLRGLLGYYTSWGETKKHNTSIQWDDVRVYSAETGQYVNFSEINKRFYYTNFTDKLKEVLIEQLENELKDLIKLAKELDIEIGDDGNENSTI